MRSVLITVVLVLGASCLTSCFLVSIPVKAAGEMIEKSAQATGEAANRSIHRVTRPDGTGGYEDTGGGSDWEDDNYDGAVNESTPLLPKR